MRTESSNAPPARSESSLGNAAASSAKVESTQTEPPSATSRITPINTPEHPWTIQELRLNADPFRGSEVWVEGYLRIWDCTTWSLTDARPCLWGRISDHPYAAGNESINLGGVPADWQQLPARSRMRVLATYDRRVVSPAEMSIDRDGLNFISSKPPQQYTANQVRPSYPDGSWSLYYLLERDDLKPGETLSVTGYVRGRYVCPPCPRSVKCKPCADPSVTLADADAGPDPLQIKITGVDEATVKSFFEIGKRVSVTGVFKDSEWPGSLAGPELEHISHRLSPDPKSLPKHSKG